MASMDGGPIALDYGPRGRKDGGWTRADMVPVAQAAICIGRG